VEGAKQHARLVLDDTEPLGIPEYPLLTAAGVVRLVYHLLLDEKQSTIAIANTLNQMGVPTASQRRGRTYYREGQVAPRQHVWRENAVNNMLSNPVYKGEYTFGRRSAHHAGRDVVTCAVAAIVTPEMWKAARAQLTKNQLVNVGNATRDYLLRGLITCGQCGYHYITESDTHPRYICVNRRHAVLLWGSRTLADERRCRDSLSLRAATLEQDIWRRLEVYLRHPDEALLTSALGIKPSIRTDGSMHE
jgi:site-specific DNA recombinase